MAKEKFYLIFSEKPNKRLQIDEPIGYSEVDFNLDQRENGMGRDVSLSGGTVKFTFTINRTHYLKDILYYNHRYGFEADVKLIIVLENGQEFIGELDFSTAETNDFDYFDCSVMVESQMQIFRRRSETKVDLFSNTTIDGETIEPLVPLNMLLKAKPSLQISKWKQSSVETMSFAKYVNITQTTEQYEIEDSYVPFIRSSLNNPFDIEDYKIISAKSSLKDVSIKVSNVDIKGVNETTSFYMRIVIEKGYTGGTKTKYIAGISNTGNTVLLSGDFPEIIIGELGREENLYMYLENMGSNVFVSNTVTSINTEVKSFSTSYNSITPTFRLIDVMKQIAKSISGLEIFAPRYDNGGQFYDTVLTSGKLLGGNTTDPFYVSWDDIEKSFRPENNADSEIQIDKRVFVGIEEDFYTNRECGFFDNTQFSELTKKANPLYCLNEFNFKYENFQSLKENTEPNSQSTIHGQSIITPYNQKVENKKECSIKWIRDAILLDVQQRLSTKVSKDTATQDDDKIFSIDTIETENDQLFSESTILQHTLSNNILFLRSSGDVNFVVLGIRTGTTFNIQYPDSNNGNYTVLAISNTELQLQRTSGGSISSANDGERLTKYTYEIKQETIPLTNRTNQGFSFVANLISPEKYSNLRYSVERNIRNYWNSYLATVNLYHKDRVLKNTFYKNNGKCETEYDGLRITEKEDWIPTNPIVTPFMYENVIFANIDFSDFITLQNNIRVKRGFIRTIDNNKRVLKLYPIKMSYENKSRQLTISGQEKFESAYLTIVKENGVITVNGETKLRNLIYEIQDGQEVVLFDLQRFRLYNGIYWDKVSVNGAFAETLEILKSWLDLLE